MCNKQRKAWFRSYIALLAILFGFTTAHFQMTTPNPVTDVREIVLVSKSQEIEIGRKHYAQMQAEMGGLYLDNPAVNAYVTRVGLKLAAVSDRPDLPYQFVVIDNDIPNAWALPGGKIAINTGLLALLDNEAELAAILAHEIAHAAARHTAQRIERDMLLNGTYAFDLATNPLALLNQTLSNAELQDFKYSRDAEREADRYGMEYMARAGYDVHAAATTHEKLKNFHREEKAPLLEGLFETHPNDDERIESCLTHEKDYGAGGYTGKEEFHSVMEPLLSQYTL